MTKFHWLSGPWRGRLGMAARPRGGGWLADEMAAWRQAGADAVLSPKAPMPLTFRSADQNFTTGDAKDAAGANAKNGLCHPERSEGSMYFADSRTMHRSFASLRMTHAFRFGVFPCAPRDLSGIGPLAGCRGVRPGRRKSRVLLNGQELRQHHTTKPALSCAKKNAPVWLMSYMRRIAFDPE
jgi:hypothetical protein